MESCFMDFPTFNISVSKNETASPPIVDDVERRSSPSEIRQFFQAKTVFLTGVSGFLGKLLLEKILYTCPEVKRIYVLMREQKGKTPECRMKEIFDRPVFSRVKQKYQNSLEKVQTVCGDLTECQMGLNDQDQRVLIDEVDCVLHCAATIRFTEHIKIAAHINVRATRDLIAIAKQMTRLVSFVYVSTAYAYPKTFVDEEFYSPGMTPDSLLKLVDTVDNNTLRRITPTLLKEWTNTYVFTKAIAEWTFVHEGQDLPLAIVRPAIVSNTVQEPTPGWTDNYNGTCGALIAVGLGVLKVIRANKNAVADIIPADYVVNSIIAAAWAQGANRTKQCSNALATPMFNQNTTNNIVIYNMTCVEENPITWSQVNQYSQKSFSKYPSSFQRWHMCTTLILNATLYKSMIFILHMVPAYVIDTFSMCVGKQPRMKAMYKQMHTYIEVCSKFALKDWHFKGNNINALWSEMNETDRKQFEFRMSTLDWKGYFEKFVKGVHIHLLKDTTDAQNKAKLRQKRLKFFHYLFCMVLAYTLLKVIFYIVSTVYEWYVC